MSSRPVQLYIYDLSRGLAATLSTLVIGKKIDGIWHTAIVVYECEYFFGSRGIESCIPGTTALGPPLKTIILGETSIPYSTFISYVTSLGHSSYTGETYNLFNHNCNNFSEDISRFLCGGGIPKYILDLPKEVNNSILAKALPSLVSQLEASAEPILDEQPSHHHQAKEGSPDFDQLNLEIEEARYNSFLLEERRKTVRDKLLRQERRKENKDRKVLKCSGKSAVPVDMVDISVSSSLMMENEVVPMTSSSSTNSNNTSMYDIESEERHENEEKRKQCEPAIVFRDIFDAKSEFDELLSLVDGKLSSEEMKSMEELQVYLLGEEGSWALSDGFLMFLGRLLSDNCFVKDVRVHAMNIMAVAALKEDIILVLHQDRRNHILMNYCFEIDRLTCEEQQSIGIFIANMFENISSSEWLMYISEWTYNDGGVSQQTSNIRVTTKVAVHCLLADMSCLQEYGAAIVHNVACKEVKSVVFDDVAVELTMAVLQYLNLQPCEEQLFRCMKALVRFIQICGQQVPQLIQMIGPDPREFKGVSDRIDLCINDIPLKLLPVVTSTSIK